jgi:hypothetical protein
VKPGTVLSRGAGKRIGFFAADDFPQRCEDAKINNVITILVPYTTNLGNHREPLRIAETSGKNLR